MQIKVLRKYQLSDYVKKPQKLQNHIWHKITMQNENEKKT